MKSKWKAVKNERGTTLAEVLICTIIVALVIGPITLSYATSVRNRATAERINTATNNAENLIREIEDQITKDIIFWQKVRGNRVDESSLTTEEKYRKAYAGYYIQSQSINANKTTIEALPGKLENADSLFEFLSKSANTADTDTTDDLARKAFEEKYSMDQYAYEVAIWPMSKISTHLVSESGNKVLKVNNTTLADTTGVSKFYSSNETKYQFDSTFYGTEPVTFKINDSIIKGFIDADKNYHMADANNDFTTLNKITIKFTDSSTDTDMITSKSYSDGNNKTKVDTISEIKGSGGKVVGYEIKIKANGSIGPSPAGDYLSVVELDVTGLLRNYKGTEANYSDFIFKIVNNTGYDQNVRVIENTLTGETTPNFTFITSGSPAKRNTVEYISDITTMENYIVAVIVREINPVLGEKGKIIKKMFDIYSYDPSVFERR